MHLFATLFLDTKTIFLVFTKLIWKGREEGKSHCQRMTISTMLQSIMQPPKQNGVFQWGTFPPFFHVAPLCVSVRATTRKKGPGNYRGRKRQCDICSHSIHNTLVAMLRSLYKQCSPYFHLIWTCRHDLLFSCGSICYCFIHGCHWVCYLATGNNHCHHSKWKLSAHRHSFLRRLPPCFHTIIHILTHEGGNSVS